MCRNKIVFWNDLIYNVYKKKKKKFLRKACDMYSYDDLSPRDGEGPVCSLGHLPADLPHVAGPGAREGCGRGGSPQVVGLARALHGHRANAGVPMIGLHGYTMVAISIGAYIQ